MAYFPRSELFSEFAFALHSQLLCALLVYRGGLRAKNAINGVLKSAGAQPLVLSQYSSNRTAHGRLSTPTHPLSSPLTEKPPRVAVCMWHMHKHRVFGQKKKNFNMTVRSGYFEYGHALRDSRCPSSVLSDGTKPQPLDRPGSGCKLHLKWAEQQKWRQPYTVRTV